MGLWEIVLVERASLVCICISVGLTQKETFSNVLHSFLK